MQGQRDTFHVKSMYFDRMFNATFYLAPTDESEDGGATDTKTPTHRAKSPATGGAADNNANVMDDLLTTLQGQEAALR